MAEIVITEFMDEDVVAGLSRDFEIVYDPTLVDDGQRLAEAVDDALALIVRNRTIVDERLLGHAARLEVVGRLGVGLDNIDLDACEQRGIAVRPATGANAVAVAEYVISAAFQLRRPVFAATGSVAAGDWPRTDLVGSEVSGATMGLVGFGAIARLVARRSLALGMEVLAHDPYVEDLVAYQGLAAPVSFEELLERSDIISVHVPLTASTRGLLGRDEFTMMKAGAVLINTSRGGIVDESALVDALRSGEIAGAALDVYSAEPVTAESGALLSEVPGLILTPHIAGVTKESNTRVSAMVAGAIREILVRGGAE